MSSAVTQLMLSRRRILRRWRRPSRRQVTDDLALGVALAALTTLEAFRVSGTEQDGPPGLALSLVVAVATVAFVVAARRTMPILSMLVASAVGPGSASALR